MKSCIVLKKRRLRALNRELYNEEGIPPQTKHVNINGHDVVEVTFCKEQAFKIFERADLKTIASIKAGAANFGSIEPTFLRKSNMIGFLGQVAWYMYAENNFEMGLDTLKIGYVPDQNDFIFKGYKGDVKTKMTPTAQVMTIPEHRFQKALKSGRFDVYVGCRLAKGAQCTIQIWGYAMVDEIASRGYIADNYRTYPFEWLHPIVELRDIPLK